MKVLISVLAILMVSILSGQITIENNTIDFGVIEKGDQRIAEIILRNEGSAPESIVKVGDRALEFDIRFSSRIMNPSEAITIRIKYNPRNKGTKAYDLPVYFTKNDPLNIKVKAQVNYLEWEDYTPCPDFDNNGNSNREFTATFKVVNKLNGDPIKNATVAIAQNGIENARWLTNRKGEVETEIPIGYYNMIGMNDGYKSARKEGYINRRNRYFIFALEPDEILAQQDDSRELEESVPGPINADESLEKGEFSLDDYAQNNIVFLIDISASMKKEQRLDILKESMIELLQMLRPEDQLSIVTYASAADILMESRPVTNKKEIEEYINGLEGRGQTAGGTGIKKAYQIAQKNFIENGNNQVYMATDGAFNKGDNNVSKLVKKKSKKGIRMSILAIKSPKWTVDKMKEITDKAKGDYLAIEEFDSAILKSLVKRQSAK